MAFIKPDLATTNEKQIASLVLSGRVVLTEIPVVQRKNVVRAVEDLERERDKAARVKLEAAADSSGMTKDDIMEALNAAGIDYDSSKRKAELFALLPKE